MCDYGLLNFCDQADYCLMLLNFGITLIDPPYVFQNRYPLPSAVKAL